MSNHAPDEIPIIPGGHAKPLVFTEGVNLGQQVIAREIDATTDQGAHEILSEIMAAYAAQQGGGGGAAGRRVARERDHGIVHERGGDGSMTIAESTDDETPLFTHACACCGDPIAARHETICEAILAIDALEYGSNIDGEFTTIYCPACLVEVLDLADVNARNNIGALLDF